MQQLIVIENGYPTVNTVRLSRRLKSLPIPLYGTGDIVIVPNAQGTPIYAVVQFACPDTEDLRWVYAVTIEPDPTNFKYLPEHLLVASDANQ